MRAPDYPSDTIVIPARPAPAARTPFPWVACLAPLGASGLIWAITHSPLTLVFAVLSPVVAVATRLDGRRHARRESRVAAQEWATGLADARAEVEQRHARARAEAQHRTPSSACVLDAPPSDLSRWRFEPTQSLLIAAGIGSIPSEIALSGSKDGSDERALWSFAQRVHDAPVPVPAEAGIGIFGDPILVTAFARGLVLQLAHRVSPTVAAFEEMPPRGWEWMLQLPHRIGPRSDSPIVMRVRECFGDRGLDNSDESEHALITDSSVDSGAGRIAQGRRSVLITLSDRPERLPATCATVIRIIGPGSGELVACPVREQLGRFRAELVGSRESSRAAVRLAGLARELGLDGRSRDLPRNVMFAQLETTQCSGLGASIGLTADGQCVIDLVTDGPHAIIGGTTGSGKSELLITWVLAIASMHSCREVTFLLVDFKGGAAFKPLECLPHCVGVITDLDDASAQRALESLRAEVQFRERALADAGVRDLSDPVLGGSIARLVIVVDEFAAMLSAFPELHALFTDLAARGRALGIHVILCTQRPAGIVRDALLANCGLRLSLRVNNAADSRAVVGTDSAASISAEQPGLAVLVVGGREVRVQIATTTQADIDGVAAAARAVVGEYVPRRPWMDPLPSVISPTSLDSPAATGTYVLGLEDHPSEQRQKPATYSPAEDAHLLVIGMHGAGKTTLVDLIASTETPRVTPVRIPRDVEGAWDALTSAVERLSWAATAKNGTRDDLLVLIDDLDSLCARLPEEHSQAAFGMMTDLLRDGPAAGVYVLATVQRLDGQLGSLGSLFSSVMRLRMSSRSDHVFSGGDAVEFEWATRPGQGSFRNRMIQLALPSLAGPVEYSDQEQGDPKASRFEFQRDHEYVLVTRRPAKRAASVRWACAESVHLIAIDDEASPAAASTGFAVIGRHDPVVYIGDPETWQSKWSLLSALRGRATMIFDDCSLADVRAVSRRRELPPPLARSADRVWVCSPDGLFTRARLPSEAEEQRPKDRRFRAPAPAIPGERTIPRGHEGPARLQRLGS